MITEDFMCLSDTVIKVLEGSGELYSQKPLLVIINHEHLKESTYTRTEPLGYQVIPQKLARGSNVIPSYPSETGTRQQRHGKSPLNNSLHTESLAESKGVFL